MLATTLSMSSSTSVTSHLGRWSPYCTFIWILCEKFASYSCCRRGSLARQTLRAQPGKLPQNRFQIFRDLKSGLRWKELPKSIRNIEGYSPTQGKMFFTDINGKSPGENCYGDIFQGILYRAAMVSRWSESQDPLSMTSRTWRSPLSYQGSAKTCPLSRWMKPPKSATYYPDSIQVDAYSVDFEGVFFGENRLLSWNECCQPGETWDHWIQDYLFRCGFWSSV